MFIPTIYLALLIVIILVFGVLVTFSIRSLTREVLFWRYTSYHLQHSTLGMENGLDEIKDKIILKTNRLHRICEKLKFKWIEDCDSQNIITFDVSRPEINNNNPRFGHQDKMVTGGKALKFTLYTLWGIIVLVNLPIAFYLIFFY